MSCDHQTALRNDMAEFVLGQLDAGSLVFLTADGLPVAILPLSNPAFGSPVNGTARANPIQEAQAIGGTIVQAELRTAGGTPKLACSVSGVDEGGDIELSKVEVEAGRQWE